jgi:tripartite-type tricarboxylate transporter receptor subunit TctC
MTVTRRSALTMMAGAAALVPSFGLAQDTDYPNRELKAICMFPAGSGADVIVRYYAAKLGQLAGKPVIVDNRVGAFGNVATEAVARSRPDGYTVYIAPGASVLAAAANTFKTLSFDPMNDFEHVTTLATLSFILYVDAKSPIRSVSELTAHLKRKGDKASYASITHTGTVATELYKQAAGVQAQPVNYRTSAQAMGDLLDGSGNLDFIIGDAGFAIEQIRAGKLRGLAVTGSKRMTAMPELPTFAEAGVPGIDLAPWWSVHVAAKTPKPIVDKLETWFNQIVVTDETRAFLLTQGYDPLPGNGRMLKEMLARDIKAWADYVRVAKIQPQ